MLFAWVFEQIGLPLPAAPMLVAAGAVAAGGSLNVMLVVVVALAASVLADYLWYRAGAFGSDTVNRFLRRHPNARYCVWPIDPGAQAARGAGAAHLALTCPTDMGSTAPQGGSGVY